MTVTVDLIEGDWSIGRENGAALAYYCSYDPDTDTDDDIEDAVFAEAPATYRNYFLESVVLRPHRFNCMRAVVRYGNLNLPDVTGATPPEFSFEIGIENIKMLCNLATVSQGAISGRVAPNHKGLIGVTDKGVEGVDVPTPTYAFSEVHYFANSAITNTYKNTLSRLVGTVNNASFRGYAAGEVLTTGVSGSVRGSDLWQLRFSWQVSPNAVNLPVGDMTVASKRGWDYLEVHYDETEDTTNKVVFKTPVCVHDPPGVAVCGLFWVWHR